MPVHDWTRVDAGIFHSFHIGWMAQLNKVLNGGRLPADYYALVERHASQLLADVLTLDTSLPKQEPPHSPSREGTILAESPPKVQRDLTAIELYRERRRTLAIRHVR